MRLTDDVEATVLIAVSQLFTDSPDGHHVYSRVIMIDMYLFDTYSTEARMECSDMFKPFLTVKRLPLLLLLLVVVVVVVNWGHWGVSQKSKKPAGLG